MLMIYVVLHHHVVFLNLPIQRMLELIYLVLENFDSLSIVRREKTFVSFIKEVNGVD